MILVTGSLAYDTILDFPGIFSDSILPDKIHNLNVSFLVNAMRKSFGGCAGNIAFSLSLLGIKTAILGIVGSDFESYRKYLEKNGVITDYIKPVNNLYTSTAIGITDKRDNQIWGFYTGADSLSDQCSISEVSGEIDYAVVSPQNPLAMMKFVGEYQNKKIPYLFDPGMQLPWLTKDNLLMALEKASIMIGNDYEVEIMQKRTGIESLHDHFKSRAVVITTLAGQGSIVSDKSGSFQVPSVTVGDVRDPAGAGDAFRAGFLAGYLRKLPTIACARMGNVAAAYAVEQFGTSTHLYTIKEFQKRYKDAYHDSLNL